MSQSFTLDDFVEQLQAVKKMGPLEDMLKMLPGANKIKGLDNVKVDEKHMGRVEAIIYSMTKAEKTHPEIMNASRKSVLHKGLVHLCKKSTDCLSNLRI